MKFLEFDRDMELLDYEDELAERLPAALRSDRLLKQIENLDQYRSLLGNVVDTEQLDAALQQAVQLDPCTERSCREGRFVPLFRSIVFSRRYDLVERWCGTTGKSYRVLFIELAPSLFRGSNACSACPSTRACQQHVIREAWQGALDYVSQVKADRDLAVDPVLAAFPGTVRFTIHHKPGQIGFATSAGFSGDPVEPWHGVGVLRTSANRTKLEYDSVLHLESLNARPIVLADPVTSTELKLFEESGLPHSPQPIGYWSGEGIEGSGVAELFDILEKNFSRML